MEFQCNKFVSSLGISCPPRVVGRAREPGKAARSLFFDRVVLVLFGTQTRG